MTEHLLDELFIGAPPGDGYAHRMQEWTPDQLAAIGETEELEIATTRADGSWRPYLPIWVVTAGERVFVRTWHRRDTGWYGRAVNTGRAMLRVPGLEARVRVADVGTGELRAEVDAAYRAKYRAGAERMVAEPAAESTLRLDPAE